MCRYFGTFTKFKLYKFLLRSLRGIIVFTFQIQTEHENTLKSYSTLLKYGTLSSFSSQPSQTPPVLVINTITGLVGAVVIIVILLLLLYHFLLFYDVYVLHICSSTAYTKVIC